MIRFNKLLVSILVLVSSTSCSEFLDMKYDSQVNENGFNSNSSELYTSLVGCYNGLQGAIYREWALTEVRTDNSRIHKTNTSSSPYTDILGLDYGAMQTNNIFVEEYWDAAYSNIKNCNIVIRDVDVVEDEQLRNEYLAEAMFIRSYHYFNLVRLYAGVPLVLTKLSVDEANTMGRDKVETVYDQIQSDLETIISGNMLPVERQDSELGRVTELAAKSLLAKVYMTRYEPNTPEYLKTESLLSDVINVVGTTLIPYTDIFNATNEMNSEIIFAVRFKSDNVGLGSLFGNEFAPMQSGTSVVNGDGKSFNYPSGDFINNYEAGDLRKDVTIAESYVDNTTGDIKQDPYVKKYLTDGQVAFDGESDWPVIRLADVILLYAELLNEKGDMSGAQTNVDNIRARAGLAPLGEQALLNKSTMRDAIRNERRMELAFENHRWFDMVRWGIAEQVVNEHFLSEQDGVFYEVDNPQLTEQKTILPIPYTVINVNPSMSQNAGY